MKNLLLQVLRWLARIIGPLVLAYFAFAVVVGSQAMDSSSQAILSLCAVGLAFLGYIIAWSREGVGGAMMVAGGIGLAVFLGEEDLLFYLFAGGPFVVVGTSFLVCWWIAKRQHT